MNNNPVGNPNANEEDSINALEQDLTRSGLHHASPQKLCCRETPQRIPDYNPYSSGRFNLYETTKQDADKDIELMLQMKNGQQPGTHSAYANSMYKLGDYALPPSARAMIQQQRDSNQTPFNVYHDQSDVPLNLNPQQVQNVEDQYLAYRYNSQTGFNPSTSQGQNLRGNGYPNSNPQSYSQTNGANGTGPNNQGQNNQVGFGFTESQLQRSSYNMAKDKSTHPPLPNVHPNHNLGEYKMYESGPVSVPSNPQSKNTYQQTAVPSNAQSGNTYQQTAIQTLETNSKGPAPQRRQPYPADNPMRFYREAQKSSGLDKFSNVSSQGNPLNTHNPAMMEYYSRINEEAVAENPYKTYGRRGNRRARQVRGGGGKGGMVQGRGGVAFNL